MTGTPTIVRGMSKATSSPYSLSHSEGEESEDNDGTGTVHSIFQERPVSLRCNFTFILCIHFVQYSDSSEEEENDVVG